jgi:5'(3')-deoxyribonucleotidase
MRIGIDLDDVTLDFMKAFRYFVAAKMGLPPSALTLPTQWHFAEEWGLTPQRLTEFMRQFAIAGNYGALELIDGARDGIFDLRDRGHEIVIITARGAAEQADGLMRTHIHRDTLLNLAARSIHYDEIHFSPDKVKVVVDVLLDDGQHQLTSFGNVRGGDNAICFSRPHNQKYKGPRVHTWREFVDLIDARN